MKDTRKKIMETTIQLFKEQGYEKTTINEICNTCGITKGTFYYHFSSKDEIAFSYYDEIFQDITSIMPELFSIENAKEQLWKLLEYSIDNTTALSPSLLNAFILSDIKQGLYYFSPFKSMKASEQRKNMHDMQLNIIKQGQKRNEIKQGDPVNMLHTFVAALIGIAIDWSSNKGYYDEKKALRNIFDVIF